MRYSISAENLLWLLVGMASQAHPQKLNEILEEAELIMPPSENTTADSDAVPPAKPE